MAPQHQAKIGEKNKQFSDKNPSSNNIFIKIGHKIQVIREWLIDHLEENGKYPLAMKLEKKLVGTMCNVTAIYIAKKQFFNKDFRKSGITNPSLENLLSFIPDGTERKKYFELKDIAAFLSTFSKNPRDFTEHFKKKYDEIHNITNIIHTNAISPNINHESPTQIVDSSPPAQVQVNQRNGSSLGAWNTPLQHFHKKVVTQCKATNTDKDIANTNKPSADTSSTESSVLISKQLLRELLETFNNLPFGLVQNNSTLKEAAAIIFSLESSLETSSSIETSNNNTQDSEKAQHTIDEKKKKKNKQHRKHFYRNSSASNSKTPKKVRNAAETTNRETSPPPSPSFPPLPPLPPTPPAPSSPDCVVTAVVKVEPSLTFDYSKLADRKALKIDEMSDSQINEANSQCYETFTKYSDMANENIRQIYTLSEDTETIVDLVYIDEAEANRIWTQLTHMDFSTAGGAVSGDCAIEADIISKTGTKQNPCNAKEILQLRNTWYESVVAVIDGELPKNPKPTNITPPAIPPSPLPMPQLTPCIGDNFPATPPPSSPITPLSPLSPPTFAEGNQEEEDTFQRFVLYPPNLLEYNVHDYMLHAMGIAGISKEAAIKEVANDIKKELKYISSEAVVVNMIADQTHGMVIFPNLRVNNDADKYPFLAYVVTGTKGTTKPDVAMVLFRSHFKALKAGIYHDKGTTNNININDHEGIDKDPHNDDTDDEVNMDNHREDNKEALHLTFIDGNTNNNIDGHEDTNQSNEDLRNNNNIDVEVNMDDRKEDDQKTPHSTLHSNDLTPTDDSPANTSEIEEYNDRFNNLINAAHTEVCKLTNYSYSEISERNIPQRLPINQATLLRHTIIAHASTIFDWSEGVNRRSQTLNSEQDKLISEVLKCLNVRGVLNSQKKKEMNTNLKQCL